MGKLLKGPLMVSIPLIALLMVAGIGIPFGLLFIQLHNSFGSNATLFVAVGMTAAIMAGAGLLTSRGANAPSATEPTPVPRSSGPRLDDSGAGRDASTRPVRGRSRSNARRKNR